MLGELLLRAVLTLRSKCDCFQLRAEPRGARAAGALQSHPSQQVQSLCCAAGDAATCQFHPSEWIRWLLRLPTWVFAICFSNVPICFPKGRLSTWGCEVFILQPAAAELIHCEARAWSCSTSVSHILPIAASRYTALVVLLHKWKP